MAEKNLSITCPLCGRKYDKPVNELFEGAEIICPLCGVKLMLHGHMWQDIQKEFVSAELRSAQTRELRM